MVTWCERLENMYSVIIYLSIHGTSALLLLVTVFESCENPRFPIIQALYNKAHTIFVRLLSDMIWVVKKLVSICYLI